MRSYCGGEVNESDRDAAGCNVLPSRLPNVGIVSDQTFRATSQSLCKVVMNPISIQSGQLWEPWGVSFQ